MKIKVSSRRSLTSIIKVLREEVELSNTGTAYVAHRVSFWQETTASKNSYSVSL